MTQSFKNEGSPSPVAIVASVSSNNVSSIDVPAVAENAFNSLGLAEPILRAVIEQGYTTPTPIQAQAIPIVLAGRDLLGAAQTGTGKTAGFTLPMLHRLSTIAAKASSKDRYRPVRALILTPTRELCAQVQESVRVYGKHVKLSSTSIYGGVGFMPQVQALRRGVDILVATPGRLLDHVQQRTVDLRNIEILVLDEADRMLDMGFIPDMRRIISLLPKERQTLLFSATFSEEIRKLAQDFQRDPATVEVARRNAPIELVTQVVHPVDKDRKRDLLAHLVKSNNWQQVLVFCKTKHGANRLAEQLGKDGIDSDAIHGNKSQPQRMRALKRFKDMQLQVLVATDIAARGIDIDALPHVVNYDMPNVAEDYVHRIGRTGRAGIEGDAVSLVCAEDRPLLAAVERLIGKRVEMKTIEGFAPAKAWSESRPAARPSSGRRPAQGQRQGQNRGQDRGQRGAAPRQEQDRPANRTGGRPDERRFGNSPPRGEQARRGRPGQAQGQGSQGRGGRSAPVTSWETEREAQRKHFAEQAGKTSEAPKQGVLDKMANLFRKVA